MLRFAFVASGSKGNATLIDSGKTLIQIDMGVSLICLEKGLELLGREREDIQAVFITHEHSDHVKGLDLYHGAIPVHASHRTLECPTQEFEFGVGVEVGDITVLPFRSSHDAANPANFLILCGKERFCYVTDTGVVFEENLPMLEDCDYYLFESNYDPKMLQKSKRPSWLKKRIRGDCGHLSNGASADYVASLVGPHTKAIYLAHISEECNTPELAKLAYIRKFEKKDIPFPSESIIPTRQWSPVLGGDIE